MVDDVVVALGRLARHVVDVVDPTVLALTGSQGKTGTKDYLAQVLAGVGETVATAGNLNNELGVPLTVLRCTADTEYLVVEMGARGVGHVAELCRIAPPDVAAVLNVGTAHLGEFGSREAIAQAKGEIVEALGPDATAVLNAGDDLVVAMRERTPARVLTFGEHGDVSWREVRLDDLGRASFELGHAGEWHPVSLDAVRSPPGPQRRRRGGDGGRDRRRPRPLRPCADRRPWRPRGGGWSCTSGPTGWSWSTTPTTPTRPRWPPRSTRWSRSVGVAARGPSRCSARCSSSAPPTRRSTSAWAEYAARCGVDVVVAVGEPAAGIARGAAAVPGWQGVAVATAGRDEALAWVRENAAVGDPARCVVLVKASRGAALESVAEGLLHPVEEEEGSR